MPSWVSTVQFSMMVLVSVFQLFLGIKATTTFSQTGVKRKAPIYITIWTIILIVMAVQYFETFNYLDTTFFHIERINLFTLKVLAINIHEFTIYGALFLIIYHTWALNRTTIKLA